MEKVRFVQYKGKKILLEDFSGLEPGKEFTETLDIARKTIASQPPKSVLAVLDATNAHYDNETLGLLKDFVKANTPYIKAATVVGITGLLGIALRTVVAFSGRSFEQFKTREEAMNWLTEQQ
jgi:hypothetical protein